MALQKIGECPYLKIVLVFQDGWRHNFAGACAVMFTSEDCKNWTYHTKVYVRAAEPTNLSMLRRMSEKHIRRFCAITKCNPDTVILEIANLGMYCQLTDLYLNKVQFRYQHQFKILNYIRTLGKSPCNLFITLGDLTKNAYADYLKAPNESSMPHFEDTGIPFMEFAERESLRRKELGLWKYGV